MSPVQRSISGPALTIDLTAELRILREQLAASSRTARTLVKNGPLRATLMGLSAGGALAPHSAEGPITVQVLEGAIEFEAEGVLRNAAAPSAIVSRAATSRVIAPPACPPCWGGRRRSTGGGPLLRERAASWRSASATASPTCRRAPSRCGGPCRR